VNGGDIVAALLLVATVGGLFVAPICYLCISGYREDQAERITHRRQEAQIHITLLEHKFWPDRTTAWYGHDNCRICGIYADPPRPTLPDPGLYLKR
jgi:hypothetical protein